MAHLTRRAFQALALLTLAFAFLIPQAQAQDAASAPRAKHVFLLIGDGMGLSQREAAARYLAGKDGSKLAMESLPNSELTVTDSLSGVTDSAAAGTALACGVKTKNGVLGLDGDGKISESIAELAKRKGIKIGILSSTPLNHATPAAFYAHISSRGGYSEISSFIPASGFELLAGDEFLLSKGEAKPDQLLKDAGYAHLKDFSSYAAFKGGKAVFEQKRPFSIDARGGEPFTSAKLLSKAIELLDGPDGFFIMLEGARIDWSCHENDLPAAVMETIDFDGAVRVAYEFLRKNPSDTLLVVTADHETGALSFTGKDVKLSDAVDGQRHSKSHMNGYMESAKKAKAPYEEVRSKMLEEFGLKEISAEEEKSLKDAYAAYMEDKSSDARAEEIKKMYGGKNPVVTACSRMLDAKAGVKWGSTGHSGAKVKTTAAGLGSALFKGESDNTQIPAKIKKAMALE